MPESAVSQDLQSELTQLTADLRTRWPGLRLVGRGSAVGWYDGPSECSAAAHLNALPDRSGTAMLNCTGIVLGPNGQKVSRWLSLRTITVAVTEILLSGVDLRQLRTGTALLRTTLDTYDEQDLPFTGLAGDPCTEIARQLLLDRVGQEPTSKFQAFRLLVEAADGFGVNELRAAAAALSN